MVTAIQRTNGAHDYNLMVGSEQWSLMLQQADVLLKSGFLPSAINSPAKAAAVMLKGWELRIPAMYALSNIAIINGKPVASAELMLALIYRDHGDGAVHFLETSDQACVLAYRRRGWAAAQEFSFTLEDARRAKLMDSATWQKFTPAMLRARAISAVARLAFPDSIGGLYTPEELGAAVAVDVDTGEVRTVDTATGEIQGEAREVPAEPTPAQSYSAAVQAADFSPQVDEIAEARQRLTAMIRECGLSRGQVRTFCEHYTAGAGTPAQIAAVEVERALAEFPAWYQALTAPAEQPAF
jgi:hypothetical protein